MTEQHTMFGSIVRTAVALIILAVGIISLAVMVVMGKPKPEVDEPEKAQSTLVETTLVAAHQGHLDIDVDGVVVPSREITVAAEVGGQVIAKADVCEAGKYVRKDTLLVKIDPRDYELEKLRLQEEFKQANASLGELDVEEKNTTELITLARDSLKLQEKEVARLEELAQRNEKYVTESQMDTERRNVLTARNTLVTLENQLRTLKVRRGRLLAARDLVQANLDKADLNLSRTEIRAPIDGMVVRDSVELDAYVAPGTMIALIEDVSTCDVRCNLRMEELYWIWNQKSTSESLNASTTRSYLLPPTPTTVIYRLGDHQYEWNGVLSRYDGIGLDEVTRTVPCIVVVDKPDKIRERGADLGQAIRGPTALVRGMYVELMIHAQPQTPLLQVPTAAIRPGNKVFRVRNGQLTIVSVNVISVMGDLAVISTKQQPLTLGKQDQSLVPGDQVVVSQMPKFYNGMLVHARLEKRP